MHNINDDIDELLRRAAERYPLKTDGGDWNKVFTALHPEHPPVASASKSKNKYRLLGLLFFLSLPLVCDYLIQKQSGQTAFSPTNPVTAPVGVAPASVKDKEQTSQKASATSEQNDKKEHGTLLTPIAKRKENSSPSMGYSQQPVSNHFTITAAKRATVASSGSNGKKTENTSQNQKGSASSEVKKQMSETVSTTPGARQSSSAANHPAVADTASHSRAQLTLPSAQKTDTTATPFRAQQPGTASVKALYISVVAGPDASTIKLQSIKTGYNIGIVLGYQFHRKWLVEAGAFWSKKSYYSDAERINTSKFYTPANTKLKTVEGDCHMIEIPVAIRYNFRSTERRNWFAALGLSSYLMKKEDYEYTYDSQTGSYDYYKTYRNATTNLFSVAYAGIGLQQSIGRTTSVRIEPYLKMPLKGLGIGSLPITSAGFTVGITKRIF